MEGSGNSASPETSDNIDAEYQSNASQSKSELETNNSECLNDTGNINKDENPQSTSAVGSQESRGLNSILPNFETTRNIENFTYTSSSASNSPVSSLVDRSSLSSTTPLTTSLDTSTSRSRTLSNAGSRFRDLLLGRPLSRPGSSSSSQTANTIDRNSNNGNLSSTQQLNHGLNPFRSRNTTLTNQNQTSSSIESMNSNNGNNFESLNATRRTAAETLIAASESRSSELVSSPFLWKLNKDIPDFSLPLCQLKIYLL